MFPRRIRPKEIKGDDLKGNWPSSPKIVLNDELLLSQVISQEAIIRLLVQKGIFTKEEFSEMVEAVNLEIKKMG